LLSSAEKKEAAGARFPLKRVGEPQDVANLATYLLGEESSWMSGQVIGLDGGQSTLAS
jgi:NAD(P)-dependent dehydrogenase (short-subunit alcohol dehydrogenase family)